MEESLFFIQIDVFQFSYFCKKFVMNFIEELRWRGMIHDMTPGTEEQLQKEMTSAYIGYDPTSDSLHIGNLASIMMLVHLQRAGHKPFALIGGATGMIGDPSGKSEERNLLDENILRYNQQAIKTQLKKFLDFDCGKHSAEMVNNYDWTKEFSLLHFLRDVGKHITVNYMVAKDSVKTGWNRVPASLSPSSPTNLFRVMISAGFMKTGRSSFRWVAPTSGEIS